MCRPFLITVVDFFYQRLSLYVAPGAASVFLPLTLLYRKTIFLTPLRPAPTQVCRQVVQLLIVVDS